MLGILQVVMTVELVLLFYRDIFFYRIFDHGIFHGITTYANN